VNLTFLFVNLTSSIWNLYLILQFKPLLLTCRALYERVVVLEQRNREQDIVIANMSKQLSAFAVAKMKQNHDMLLRYCMGHYVWKVDNFKARLDAMVKDHYKMLYSPGFYTSPNGYR
jgi:TNF receptor-associated factor 6